jgi:carboxyl-terminal processing protease
MVLFVAWLESLGDQYSSYMSAEEYTMFNSDISGDIEGIGVVIRTNEDTNEVEVINVLEGAPARAAGVLPGDIFWEVDGVSVVGMPQDELARRVRGQAGSQVTIIFKRGEEFVELTITRARFEIPNVESRILDGDIAYIKLSEFNQRARQQLMEAIEDVNVNEQRGLIFDLRGNPWRLIEFRN